MEKEEAEFQRQVLGFRSRHVDVPEIIVNYARWLIDRNRLKDAELLVWHALDEGPRFDLYELRALTTLDNLSRLWRDIHEKLNRKPEQSSTAIYNNGMDKEDPDWNEVLKNISGH